MTGITATRTSPFTPPAAPSRTTPKPSRGRRTVADPGRSSSVGRSDRPVLRIVARNGSLERASAVEASQPPLRQVDLTDFFAAEYDGDDVAVTVARPRPQSVRLTRRGRLAVFGAGLAAALGLGFVAATGSLADDKPEPTRVVVVQPGQTLWSIASSISSGGDLRATMSHLEAINHLDSPTLRVGQHLRVPR